VLKLGYSLVKSGGQVVKKTAGLSVGDMLDIELHKGKIGVKVEKIID